MLILKTECWKLNSWHFQIISWSVMCLWLWNMEWNEGWRNLWYFTITYVQVTSVCVCLFFLSQTHYEMSRSNLFSLSEYPFPTVKLILVPKRHFRRMRMRLGGLTVGVGVCSVRVVMSFLQICFVCSLVHVPCPLWSIQCLNACMLICKNMQYLLHLSSVQG
jgi:hypothetical protein